MKHCSAQVTVVVERALLARCLFLLRMSLAVCMSTKCNSMRSIPMLDTLDSSWPWSEYHELCLLRHAKLSTELPNSTVKHASVAKSKQGPRTRPGASFSEGDKPLGERDVRYVRLLTMSLVNSAGKPTCSSFRMQKVPHAPLLQMGERPALRALSCAPLTFRSCGFIVTKLY